MTDSIAIVITNISKIYKLYDRPRDRLKEALHPFKKKYHHEFHALNNINFSVKKGETVGILGENGAGKSTLLKIITGVLTPSSGNVIVNGKVASLLELGAGFNPDYTGLENVYFQGALMGFTEKEMDARVGNILEFAGIGEFIHQPVKTYSSGMFVRLAFAVIANVDADILIIDEALAVGDAVFTQKCMRYIREYQGRGTLIFVSHDTNAILSLCQTAVWLHGGEIQQIGDSKLVAQSYLQHNFQESYGDTVILKAQNPRKAFDNDGATPPDFDQQSDASILDYGADTAVINNLSAANGWKTGVAEIVEISLNKSVQHTDPIMVGGEWVCMSITAHTQEILDQPILGFSVKDRLGQELFGENTLPFTNLSPKIIPADGTFTAKFTFRLPMLPNGEYSVTASVANGDLYKHVQHHWLHDALIIRVSSSKVRWGLVGVDFKSVSLEFSDAL